MVCGHQAGNGALERDRLVAVQPSYRVDPGGLGPADIGSLGAPEALDAVQLAERTRPGLEDAVQVVGAEHRGQDCEQAEERREHAREPGSGDGRCKQGHGSIQERRDLGPPAG